MVEPSFPDPVSKKVIGCAIEVHKHLGPGLLESAYERCLACELQQNGIAFRQQVPLPVAYKGIDLYCAYRMDLVVDDCLVLEIKSVEQLLPKAKQAETWFAPKLQFCTAAG